MIIYGINPVTEALQSKDSRLQRIYVTRGKSGPRIQKIIELARSRGIQIRFEPPQVLRSKAGTDRHQEVVAEIGEASYLHLHDLLQSDPQFLLLVDGVEDPHNLGAVLRTAEAAGVDGVLLPERRTCGITPAVVKSSAGAALHLSAVRIGNVVQTLERLKGAGFWTVGLDMRGKDETSAPAFRERVVVVVGGEHRGVRRLVREHCDFLISLPMRGRVSSLNLSVAAGVLLYRLLEVRGSG